MFFWLANFVIALGQVTLAGAFASYYWAFKKPDDMPAFPLFSSFGRALRYKDWDNVHILSGDFPPQIAIYGTNFCTSARNAFFLLMRNIVRVAVLDKVTDFLLFLGKLLIVGSVGILAFFFFTHRIKVIQDTAPPLNYYWVPILVGI
nr:choline transporter-like protein 2 [Zootoca vivipara]